MIDIFSNPLIIAACEIDTVQFSDNLWHITGAYQHHLRKKRYPLRIQVKTEHIIGEILPGQLLVAVGRLIPAGRSYQVHLRADYAEVLTLDEGVSADALDGSISHLTNQLAGIKQRIEIMAEYEQLEAARRRLGAALCNLNMT